MSRFLAQTANFPLRRLELLSAELRLLQGAIVQLHERFDLLLEEISALQCDHAIDCELTADASRSDMQEPAEFADDPRGHPVHTTAKQAPSLSDRLSGLKGLEITSPDALTAAPSDTHEPTIVGAAGQAHRDAVLAPLDRPSCSEVADGTNCMRPAIDCNLANPAVVAAMRPIPPWDIVASGSPSNKRIRHVRSFARGAAIAAALMAAAGCALALMSPFTVTTQPAVADPLPVPDHL
jgi:hypothetical protein